MSTRICCDGCDNVAKDGWQKTGWVTRRLPNEPSVEEHYCPTCMLLAKRCLTTYERVVSSCTECKTPVYDRIREAATRNFIAVSCQRCADKEEQRRHHQAHR